MNAYLVRLKKDHEFVGIFVAGSLGELSFLIDQACPPEDCEYAILPAGGMIAGGDAPPTPAEMPEDEDLHEEHMEWWFAFMQRATTLDEYWQFPVLRGEELGGARLAWRPMFPCLATSSP